MPIKTDSLNRKLYDILDSRGYNPTPRDSDVNNAGKTVPPEEADVFKFTFRQNDEDIDDAWVTIDGAENLTLYYDHTIADKASEKSSNAQFDDSWYGLLNFLKKWAHSRQLSFKLEPKEKINSDMAQRTYMKKKEQIAEGYYPMGNKASYSDAIPTVKIVLQHTRQIQEGEQRYRNVARIFLENTHGERILAPTIKPGIAQIYARHLAEGGVPNDERWNHIKSLCEEYGKMAGFVRAVRGNQFNESAQRLVEAGLNHYQNLRESLGKMRGHRGYNAYFESWTPTLMETEGDESNLNELFVQETLDPRIESVMPILSKLKLNLGEMKEVNELAEWADNVTEDEGRQALNPVGIPENEEGMAEAAKWRRDDLEGKTWRDSDWDDGFLAPDKIKLDRDGNDVDDIGDELNSRPGMWRGKADMAKRMTKKGVPTKSELGFQNNLKMRMKMKKKEGGLTGPKGVLPEEGVAEGSLNELSKDTLKSYTQKADAEVTSIKKKQADDPRNRISDTDFDKKQQRQIGLTQASRRIEKKNLTGVAEGEIEDAETAHQKINTPAAFRKAKGGDWKVTGKDIETSRARTGTSPEGLAAIKKLAGLEEPVIESKDKTITIRPEHEQEMLDWLESEGFDVPESTTDEEGNLVYDFSDMDHGAYMYASDFDISSQETDDDLAEELDANQKRVGQLGPTEKVKNNNIGKLVGANESVEHDPLKDMLKLLGK